MSGRRTTRAGAAKKAAAGVVSPPAVLAPTRRRTTKAATATAAAATPARATAAADTDDADASAAAAQLASPVAAKPKAKATAKRKAQAKAPAAAAAEETATAPSSETDGKMAAAATTTPVVAAAAAPALTTTVPAAVTSAPAAAAAPVAPVAAPSVSTKVVEKDEVKEKKAAELKEEKQSAAKKAASPKKPAAAAAAATAAPAAAAPAAGADDEEEEAFESGSSDDDEQVLDSDGEVEADSSDDGEGDDEEDDEDDEDDNGAALASATAAVRAAAAPRGAAAGAAANGAAAEAKEGKTEAKKMPLWGGSSARARAAQDSDGDSDDEKKGPAAGTGKKSMAAVGVAGTGVGAGGVPARVGYTLHELDLGAPPVLEKRKEGETPEERAARRKRNARLIRAQGKSYLPESERAAANLAEQSDSSEEEGGMMNRIGAVPLEWYDKYDHIGYDIHGKKIVRPQGSDSLDRLLSRADDPNYGRTINDPLNGKKIILSAAELDMIERLRKGKYTHGSFDPHPDYVDWFTSEKQIEMVGNAQRPKAGFIPSKHEARHVARLVNAIRNGWVRPSWEQAELEKKKAEEDDAAYLIWGDDGNVKDAGPGRSKPPASIAPPKAALPGHGESYNPPPEYLPTEEEIAKWEAAEPEERSLREVGAYPTFINERFERCLDLYLCPRIKRTPKRVDPNSLIPKLPSPAELRPFPSQLSIEYKGHTARVRTICVSPCGQWMASGSDDATVRLWEVDTGRCFRRWDLKHIGEVIDVVSWNPNPTIPLLAAAVGNRVMLLHTMTGSEDEMKALEAILSAPLSTSETVASADAAEVQTGAKARAAAHVRKNVAWGLNARLDTPQSTDPNPLNTADPSDVAADVAAATRAVSGVAAADEPAAGAAKKKRKPAADGEVDPANEVKWSRMSVDVGTDKRVKSVVWHHKGDYFATYSAEASATSILIHRLSKNQTQTPFSKSKGLIQAILFHPTKPFFFVASQRNVRVYDLAREQLVKKLHSPAKWISSMSIHPSGDHLLIGSYDRKLCWYDLDAGNTPYKSLKYHKKAVRSVAYHTRYPLFASASDDGKLHIFHGRVYSDLMTEPLIVPVKILHAHHPVDDLGVLSCTFHPHQPWVFSSGGDSVIRLFT